MTMQWSILYKYSAIQIVHNFKTFLNFNWKQKVDLVTTVGLLNITEKGTSLISTIHDWTLIQKWTYMYIKSLL